MTNRTSSTTPVLRIGILGTGNIALAVGTPWAARGHRIIFGGRSLEKARALAAAVGHGATSASLAGAVRGVDVVLLAIPWAGVSEVLANVAAATGALSGVTVIDPTNPIEHGGGRHLLETGSAAGQIAARAAGARVVKAFNVYPATQWGDADPRVVVTLAGDDPTSIATAMQLVRDVGATPHVLGGLDRARQVEELASVAISLQFAGVDPRAAVPGRA